MTVPLYFRFLELCIMLWQDSDITGMLINVFVSTEPTKYKELQHMTAHVKGC